MKIRIYQVNMERDSENLAFMGSDFVMKKHGDLSLDSSIYDSVFEGTVECRSLEDVYDVFNKRTQPATKPGRCRSLMWSRYWKLRK